MRTISKLNNFFIAGLSILVFACNSSKKEEPAKDKTTADTTIAAKPAVTTPPDINAESATKRCFENDGLKYNTTITLSSSATKVTGTVTSEDMSGGTKQSAEFSGMITGDTLTVTFKGTAPVVGGASEWTHKGWIIKKSGRKEKLLIVFNAKNYDTNKWENTIYEFDPCK